MPTDPADHYDEYGEHEWERLEQGLYGRLEWEETVHWLTQELPESGRVLDAGGGAGRYAVWLADQGYDVDLVDPSERQVELATGKASERGVADSVHTQVGDVRDLSFDDHTFDATLCLGGPLSHVLDEAGREQAAAELARVTADGGPVFVSVMGKLAALQTITRMAGKVPEEEDETELLPALAEAGDYDEELVASIGQELTAPPMHLFRVDELEALLEGAGIDVETVTALESIASQRRGDFEKLTDAHREAIREAVQELRGDRGAADLSGHVLAVGWA